MLASPMAGAQELVPAAYTPAPSGINLVTLTATYNGGDVSFDPALPVEDASADIVFSALGYARTFSLAGRAANIGEFTQVHRSGVGDVGARLAVNLFGAPAMSFEEFASYRPDTLIGLSLSVTAPTGQYDPSKAINIGTNRWALRPEIGLVRVIGRWALDAYLGASFFSTNPDFFGGGRREQDPILSTQAHLRRSFGPRVWAAVDANFWWGGQTAVDGVTNDDVQSNSRVGLTVATRFGRHHTLRIAISTGAITRVGGDFDSIGASYGYSWRGRP